MISMLSNDLQDFATVLVQAIKSIKKAAEMPSYMNAKAREINAPQIKKLLQEQMANTRALTKFNDAHIKQSICNIEGFEKKKMIIDEIKLLKNNLERVKSGNFKLMLDRFIAAHELAIELSPLLDQIEESALKNPGGSDLNQPPGFMPRQGF